MTTIKELYKWIEKDFDFENEILRSDNSLIVACVDMIIGALKKEGYAEEESWDILTDLLGEIKSDIIKSKLYELAKKDLNNLVTIDVGKMSFVSGEEWKRDLEEIVGENDE